MKDYLINKLKVRLALLENRGRENGAICNKIRRQIRNLEK